MLLRQKKKTEQQKQTMDIWPTCSIGTEDNEFLTTSSGNEQSVLVFCCCCFYLAWSTARWTGFCCGSFSHSALYQIIGLLFQSLAWFPKIYLYLKFIDCLRRCRLSSFLYASLNILPRNEGWLIPAKTIKNCFVCFYFF